MPRWIEKLCCKVAGFHTDMQYTMGEFVFTETETQLVTVHIMVCIYCGRIGETAGGSE